MYEIVGLTFPFFALIFLGYLCGKIFKLPQAGLAWLTVYIVYVALPALFYDLIAKTPFEKLLSFGFVFTALFATFCAFLISAVIGAVLTRGGLANAAIQGEIGGYSNIGYMGPPLTISALGQAASAPAALIFAFENVLHFSLVPLMMALSGRNDASLPRLLLQVLRRVMLHPFIIATICGFVGAYFALQLWPPLQQMVTYLRSSAAPCALFTLGVTVAMRPVSTVPWEMPFLLLVKLVLHPFLALLFLSIVGDFDPIWVYTAIIMAALPPALNVFVMAQQYDVYVERASTSILVGTIISVFTVTGLIFLIKHGYIPHDLFPSGG